MSEKTVLNKLVPSISATDTGNDKHFITRSFLEMSALVLLAMSMKENQKSTIVQSSLRQTFLFVLLLSQFLRGHVDFHTVAINNHCFQHCLPPIFHLFL